MYKYVSDKGTVQKSSLTMSEILTYITQEEIFELVFEEKPQLGELYVSPFRKDNYPSCWFSYDSVGKLFFVDFGTSEVIKGIKISHVDCFSAVLLHYKFNGLNDALSHIKNKLIDNVFENKIKESVKKTTAPKILNDTNISIIKRPYNSLDASFWLSWRISSKNLIEDRVFAIQASTILKKDSIKSFYHQQITYAYCEFADNRKKIYSPKKTENRFITNCNNKDLGGFSLLPFCGKLLIITKGYKDYRAIKNLGYNVVWVTSESVPPEESLLAQLSMRFQSIIIWYDNDKQGLRGSEQLQAKLDQIRPGKTKRVWHNFHKDPSDFQKADYSNFLSFVNNYLK
jgi:5S rRNA maturation endonuclease (ribonuclease M5)